MIIIIRALPQWGKDDGDYDSPTSRYETQDEKERKRKAKKRESKKMKKWEKKREGAMLLSFYHTHASE